MPSKFAGREVLEVGAGTGACGLYAAALGASRVVLTEGGDESPPLLSLLAENARRNERHRPATARVDVAVLHWGCEPLPAGPFAWVIGSDVTWGSDDDAHDGLSATLAAVLRRDAGARVVLAMEHGLPLPVDSEGPSSSPPMYRDETLEQFRAAASAHGLQVAFLWEDGAQRSVPEADALGRAELLLQWPAGAFSAFTPHTTSDVFLVEVSRTDGSP